MKEVTGNLQVKNGKYYVLVNLYDRSGKRSIKWVALGLDARGNKKAAKARMAEVLEEYNRSQRKLLRTISKKKAPEKFIQQREQVQYQTLPEFLTDWINLSSGRLQPSTIDGYMKMVNGRITEFFGNSGITIGDLAGEDLNDFYAYLEDSGLSGASALRYHGLIHAAFSYAVKKELIDDNPCDHADHPKRERYRASFYSEDELRDLLIAARESPIYIPVWGCILMGRIGYIRVSTEHQETARQEAIMKQYKVERVFAEKMSGKNVNRPELKAMLEYVREGDTLYIESISRLGRSTRDLLNIIDVLQKKGVTLVSSKENIDTNTPQGRFVLSIFAALSELEREQTLQRQREGIAIAKSQGKYKGRQPLPIDWIKFGQLYEQWQSGTITAVWFQKEMGLQANTFYRRLKEYKRKIK